MTINPLTTASAANPASSASGSIQAAIGTQDTFLKLLVTELKSQDPTAPLDTAQTVGQLVSMNQLNQLIEINQTLQAAFNASGNSAPTSSSAHSAINSNLGAH